MATARSTTNSDIHSQLNGYVTDYLTKHMYDANTSWPLRKTIRLPKQAELEAEQALEEKAETENLVHRNEESIQTDTVTMNRYIDECEKVALTETQKEVLNTLRDKRASMEKKKDALNEQVKQDNLTRDALTAEINKLTENRYGEENGLAKIDAELEFWVNAFRKNTGSTTKPRFRSNPTFTTIPRAKKRLNA